MTTRPGSRWRLLASLAALSVLVVGFQNCGGFQISSAHFSSLQPKGLGGETVTKVTPAELYSGGGTISVFGSNFTASTAVEIDGAPCAPLELVSSTELRCTIPAGPVGARVLKVGGMPIAGGLSLIDFTKLLSFAGRAGADTDVVDGVGRLARIRRAGSMVRVGDLIYFAEHNSQGALGIAIRSVDLDSSEVKSVAGDNSLDGYVDGGAAQARFGGISALAAYGDSLYVADSGNCVIRKVDLGSGGVSTIAGNLLPDDPNDPDDDPVVDSCRVLDGNGRNARFAKPMGLAIIGDDLFVSDGKPDEGVIRKLNLKTFDVITVAGRPSDQIVNIEKTARVPVAASLTTIDTLATPLETDHPWDYNNWASYEFTVERPGAKGLRVHFEQIDTPADALIQFLDEEGNTYLELGGTFAGDFWSPVFPGEKVTVRLWPYSDNTDSQYGFKIDKVAYSTADGLAEQDMYDGNGREAFLPQPRSMTSFDGKIYFNDCSSSADFCMVRMFDPATKDVRHYLGRGGRHGDPLGTTRMDFLMTSNLAMTFDGSHMLVSDINYNRVSRVDMTTGKVTDIFKNAANAGPASHIDGPLDTASIKWPDSIVYDPKRGIFIGCREVIRRIK